MQKMTRHLRTQQKTPMRILLMRIQMKMILMQIRMQKMQILMKIPTALLM